MALLAITAVLTVAAGLLVVVGALILRTRAAAAADLSALAGAAASLEGRGAACQAAAEIARRNGARLTDCAVSGVSVRVEVEQPLTDGVRRWAGGTTGVRARARADLIAEGA